MADQSRTHAPRARRFLAYRAVLPLALSLVTALAACASPAAPPATTASGKPAATAAGKATASKPQNVSFTEDQVKLAVEVEKTRAHLLVSLTGAKAGNYDVAQMHAGHALGETWPRVAQLLQPVDAGLTDRAAKALRAHQDQVVAKQDPTTIETTDKSIDTVLDEVVGKLVPATVATSLGFQARVFSDVFDSAAREYGEGVVGNQVDNLTEFQDAWGFLQRARAEWRVFEDQIKARAPKEYEEIEDDIRSVRTALPDITPPAEIVAPEKVTGWAQHAAKEVAAVVGLPAPTGAASAAPAGSPADQLEAQAKAIDSALAALQSGNVKAAQQAYLEYDEGWGKIEDGIRAKSRDAYRKIEDAMDEVKAALLRPESPDPAKATAALRTLREVITTSSPVLR